jgi:hypothetical protein
MDRGRRHFARTTASWPGLRTCNSWWKNWPRAFLAGQGYRIWTLAIIDSQTRYTSPERGGRRSEASTASRACPTCAPKVPISGEPEIGWGGRQRSPQLAVRTSPPTRPPIASLRRSTSPEGGGSQSPRRRRGAICDSPAPCGEGNTIALAAPTRFDRFHGITGLGDDPLLPEAAQESHEHCLSLAGAALVSVELQSDCLDDRCPPSNVFFHQTPEFLRG